MSTINVEGSPDVSRSSSSNTSPSISNDSLHSKQALKVSPSTHSARLSPLSEKIRKISSTIHLAHSFQCAAFCGGVSCKHENPSKWLVTEGVAFNGLSSHWITDQILAMARPSTLLFNKFNLLSQFKESGIRAVVNLQTSGEHAQCGPRLETSGFTYIPETLMKHNIYYYNYPWPDYSYPLLPVILDVVKVIDYSCSTGKVAIHCHAGLGRTGMIIACYLLYAQRLTPDDAITIIRDRRPGSIQTNGQLEVIRQFHEYLSMLCNVYPPFTTPYADIKEYLLRQSKLLHGEEEKTYRTIPKVVSILCQRIKTLSVDKAFKFRCLKIGDTTIPASGSNTCRHGNDHMLQSILLASCCRHDDIIVKAINDIMFQINSKWVWSLIDDESDPTVLFTLLFNFFTELPPNSLMNLREALVDDWQGLTKVINSYELQHSIESISYHLLSVLITHVRHSDNTSCTSEDKAFIYKLSAYFNTPA